MKRRMSFILALICAVTLCGCANTRSTGHTSPTEPTGLPSTQPEPSTQSDPSTQPEASTDAAGLVSGGEEKKLLELKHFTDSDLGLDSDEGLEMRSKKVRIPYDTIVETGWSSVSSTDTLEGILEAIQADYPELDFESWEYSVHLIADDGSWGMIRFRYRIGADILTNKAITCTYDEGFIKEITYTNMSFTLSEDEEQELIRRTEHFLNTHTQEKKVMQENERFLDEQTMITYYFNIDKLVYTYALFFEYGDGDMIVINNDYGTEVIIE